MSTPLRPACMTDAEWLTWAAGHAEIPWPHVQVKTPCFDCTEPFYREMLLAGCCDGYPGRASSKPYTAQRMVWRAASRREKDRLAAGNAA